MCLFHLEREFINFSERLLEALSVVGLCTEQLYAASYGLWSCWACPQVCKVSLLLVQGDKGLPSGGLIQLIVYVLLMVCFITQRSRTWAE